MTIHGYRKVHIVMPGLEVVRVVKPLRHIGCEKLYIIGDPSKANPDERLYYDYNQEIKRQLKGYLKAGDIHNVDVDVYDIEGLLSTLCRIVNEEKASKNLVFMNVSCGSKIFVSAAVMASMMYDAVPYFARRDGFRTDPEDLEEDGRPAGIAKDVEDPVEIPTFHLEPPEPELITVLSIIDGFEGGVLRQGDIIEELARRGVMSNVHKVERPDEGKRTVMGKRKISRKALNKFKRRYFNELLDREWVEVEGRGRRVVVNMTDRGRQIHRIFRHLSIGEGDG